MKKNVFIIIALLVLLVSQGLFAQLITVKELAAELKSGNVILLSARKPADYKKVHLPEAVNVWHADLYKPGDVKGLLKSTDEIAAVFGKVGINQDKSVVIYDSGDNMFAGRLYWLLKYLGVKDVKVLDGHMKMWRKGRKPVTKKATAATAVTFNPVLNSALITDKAHVKSSMNNTGAVLVDVRSKEEFEGTKGAISRKGHIPGAVNFDYHNILNEDGTLKAKAELEKLFKDAGITADKEVILFCETAVRSGIVYLALTSILDYSNVTVYDGAMFEWAADASCPME